MRDHRSWGTRWGLTGLVGVGAAALLTLFVVARPDLVYTSAFVFQDQGNYLLIASRLSEGARLYRDIAYPYGPLPAWLGEAVASSIGISARTHVVLQALLSAAFLALLAHLLARHVSARAAAAIVLLGVLPLSFASPTVGGAFVSPHISLERMALVALALAWTPPEERTTTSSAVPGVVLGLWQFVKVGGAAVGLTAWIVVDLVACVGQGTGRLNQLTRSWVLVLCAAMAVEACRWVGLFVALPPPIALDAAWPYYALEHYWSIPPAVRTRGLTLVELVTHGVTMVAALAVVLSGLRRQLTDIGGRRALALLLPAVFLAVGRVGYFGHREGWLQYDWAVIPAAAFGLARGSRWLRLGGMAIATPALALLLATVGGVARVSASQAVQMPNGETLWMNAPTRVAATEILAMLRAEHDGGGPIKTLVVPIGGGVCFYSGTRLPTRHAWVIDHYVRPHERAAIATQLRDIERVAFLNEPGLTDDRFHRRVGELFGDAVESQWRDRVSRIEHFRGWSLVTLSGSR